MCVFFPPASVLSYPYVLCDSHNPVNPGNARAPPGARSIVTQLNNVMLPRLHSHSVLARSYGGSRGQRPGLSFTRIYNVLGSHPGLVFQLFCHTHENMRLQFKNVGCTWCKTVFSVTHTFKYLISCCGKS